MGVQTTDTIIHLVSGGMGGTMGAIITCPLEVVKTRLQSSNSGFESPSPSKKNGGFSSTQPMSSSSKNRLYNVTPNLTAEQSFGRKILPNLAGLQQQILARMSSTSNSVRPPVQPGSTGVTQCLRFIFVHEGVAGLFKGLGPNLMGVAPSRAIYFWAYSTAKRNVNSCMPKANRDTPFVHVTSAAMAGFCASTLTNPIWLVKTRLQLDRSSGMNSLGIRQCVANIYKDLGVQGFWRGVTASYWGISETVIHFVIYEYLKKQLAERQNKSKYDEKTFVDFAGFMLCGACSKTCATIVAYPHEVARTRLREEGSVYRTFWQTLFKVYCDEGRRGLYRGLCTQLLRQIPNTAIMMSTYEMTVYVLSRWLKGTPQSKSNEQQLLGHKSSRSQ